jgi:hypothetical protein
MSAAEVQALIDSKPLAQRLAADPEVKPLVDNGGDRKSKAAKPALQRKTDLPYGNDASYLVRTLCDA